MKQLHNKVNIVPVIAKADVLTKKEMQRLKKKVLDEIAENGIRIYSLPECDSDEDEEYKEQVRQLKQAVPFAVCGSNTLLEVRGRKVRGRLFPWGVVEVENPDHCDFIKLRTMLITHMQDLQEVTQEVHYENYRSERLAKGAPPPKRNTYVFVLFQNKLCTIYFLCRIVEEKNGSLNEKDRILQEKEAELKRMQEMIAAMKAKIEGQQ